MQQSVTLVFITLVLAAGLRGFIHSADKGIDGGKDDRKRKGRVQSSKGVPTIREVEPASARVGDVVKIEGANFSSGTPIVTFNGVPAILNEIESDELRVVVPQGASSGPLVVSVAERMSEPVFFVIRSSSPPSGPDNRAAKPIVTGPAKSETLSPSTSSRLISFSKDVQTILSRSCTDCHGGNAGLFLDEGESYGNLVNIQATKGCTQEKRVLPGNSSASVLFKRISGTSCGTQMPKKAEPLSAEEVSIIRDWIDQGALNN